MADFEGMPVETVPEGAPSPTEEILQEQMVLGADVISPWGAPQLEAESNPLSGAQQYEEGLKQLWRLYAEHTSISRPLFNPAPTLYTREDPKLTESRERAIDQLASKLGLESPLGYVGMKGDDFPPYFQRLSDWIKKEYKGPGVGLSAEYQGPAPSALEEYYEARDKPGSSYRTGESILEEDPLVQGMYPLSPQHSTMTQPGEEF